MTYQLIIFDMDGTLVQSEDCASQALHDVIPALNLPIQEITTRYKGMRLAKIFADIEKDSPGAIPDNCLELYRQRENALSTSMIKPCPGVEDVLAQLTHQKCIASNAPVAKTRRSLQICGISHHFDKNIFSAYDVEAWKPDPALFLHAAKTHNVEPSNCLVVEDSEVGVMAARAAGMPVVFYNPHACEKSAIENSALCEITELIELMDVVSS